MSKEVRFRKINDYYLLDQLNTSQLDSFEYRKLNVINQLIFQLDIRDHELLRMLFGNEIQEWDLGIQFYYDVDNLLEIMESAYDKFEILKDMNFIYIIDYLPYFEKLYVHENNLYKFEDLTLQDYEIINLQPVRVSAPEFMLTMKNTESKELLTHRIMDSTYSLNN
jgi:hypothetical protein